MDIDWKRYRETFPARYLNSSPFDAAVSELVNLYVKQYGEVRALDIGGGVLGTQALRRDGVTTWLADPFVDCPGWMQGNCGDVFMVVGSFHVIVARGAFNYMTPEEIVRIPKLLRENGTFLFNTFASVKAQERRYTSLSGDGTEKVVLDGNRVIHSLVPDKGEPIVHSFFSYSKKEIELLLSGYSVSFREVGKNTLHGFVTE